jgi:hypothetical protein
MQIICPNPNCGYHGTGVGVAHGEGLALLILLLMGFLPGLLYSIFCMKGELICPQCRGHARWVDRDLVHSSGCLAPVAAALFVLMGLVLLVALARGC